MREMGWTWYELKAQPQFVIDNIRFFRWVEAKWRDWQKEKADNSGDVED